MKCAAFDRLYYLHESPSRERRDVLEYTSAPSPRSNKRRPSAETLIDVPSTLRIRQCAPRVGKSDDLRSSLRRLALVNVRSVHYFSSSFFIDRPLLPIPFARRRGRANNASVAQRPLIEPGDSAVFPSPYPFSEISTSPLSPSFSHRHR